MLRKMTLVAMAVCLWARVAVAATDTDFGSQAGYGLLAVVSNLLYMPAKVVYGAVGGLTGSLAYLVTVGNDDVAYSIWSPSLGGSWVVTPAMLRNEEPILFNGPSHSAN